MADNITLNAGSGGSDIATDQDVGLAHHQYVKVEWGPDNTQTKVDTGASALPIQDGGNSITVDGTVSVTGVATAAKQPALGTAGTASTDVITVQGIASMTALKVDGSAVTQPVSLAATVTTTEAGRAAVVHFQASIPTTAGGTQLASNACKEATVKNLLSNSNIIWVGITGVAANSGYELNPGEALTLKVSNTNLIYCLSASGSQTVCVIATN